MMAQVSSYVHNDDDDDDVDNDDDYMTVIMIMMMMMMIMIMIMMMMIMIRAETKALIGGGCIFIYSRSARRISFEINGNDN